MHKSVRGLMIVLVPAVAVVACKKNNDASATPQTAPTSTAYPGYTGYPATTTTAYPTAMTTAYPTATATPYPTAAAPTAAGTMSTPNAMALPCQSDSQCFTHRCNTSVGRCAWPCQSDNDCQAGNHCVAPACVPSAFIPQQ